MKAFWLAGTLLLLQATYVHAGNSCAKSELQPEIVRTALLTAEYVARTLNEAHAKSGLIARVGKDLSKYGLKYSHAAFFRRDEASGQWHVFQLLNECGTHRMGLWEDGLGNFFADNLFRYDALIVIPPQTIQDRLSSWLDSEKSMNSVLGTTYSMLAYPFSTKYQNSNQWILESLVGIIGGEGDLPTRANAQAWLSTSGYRPTTIKLGRFQRLGAQMLKGNIAFDDHPKERREKGQIDIVTVESIVSFMERKIPEAYKFEIAGDVVDLPSQNQK